jgi:hypothetical protein
MKLLPPREVETQTRAQKLAESQRITAIRSQLSREELELNNWNDSLEKKKKDAIRDFEDKLMVWNRNLRDIQEEVSALEEKREILLRPLDDTPELITKNLAVTEDLLNYLTHRKKEVAEAQKTLSQSLLDGKKAQKTLLEREKRLDGRELEIAERIKMVKNQELTLAQSTDEFTQSANRKNIELMILQAKLDRKEVEFAEREKLIAEANEKIIKDRARIESQQRTLIAAMQETKHKL